jgi:SAM-dependent methyltransferase
MPRHVDALTSSTLKNLREQWWDAEFSEFLQEKLKPRPGNRLLDVGCGEGNAEISLGRLRISQLKLFALDKNPERVRRTASECASHNIRLAATAADVQRLPFADGSFDATFCVAVLQHVNDLATAVGELARVTKPGGRVLAVEPDNSARYWYSSSSLGSHAFQLGSRFFNALAQSRGDTTDPAVGARLPSIFASRGVEPLSVDLFPVSVAHLGPPPASVWEARREAAQIALERATLETVRQLGLEYLWVLEVYAREAASAGQGFVELQNTMLFATLGQKQED